MESKDIVEKYPNLFRDYGGDMRTTCMAWGFECGTGWYKLLDEIGQKLTDLNVEDKVVAIQVKEKFGGLRFYYHTKDLPRFIWDWRPKSNFVTILWYHKWIRWIKRYLSKLRKYIFGMTVIERVQDIIESAEEKSYITCEICGEDGKIRGQGWLKTLCESCDKERNK